MHVKAASRKLTGPTVRPESSRSRVCLSLLRAPCERAPSPFPRLLALPHLPPHHSQCRMLRQQTLFAAAHRHLPSCCRRFRLPGLRSIQEDARTCTDDCSTRGRSGSRASIGPPTKVEGDLARSPSHLAVFNGSTCASDQPCVATGEGEQWAQTRCALGEQTHQIRSALSASDCCWSIAVGLLLVRTGADEQARTGAVRKLGFAGGLGTFGENNALSFQRSCCLWQHKRNPRQQSSSM